MSTPHGTDSAGGGGTGLPLYAYWTTSSSTVFTPASARTLPAAAFDGSLKTAPSMIHRSLTLVPPSLAICFAAVAWSALSKVTM